MASRHQDVLKFDKRMILKAFQGEDLGKTCDGLWRECVVLRAGEQSEVSRIRRDPDRGIYLQAHHIIHKPNRRLRYELLNGICLTKGEHLWGIHGSREEEFRRMIQNLRGADIYDKLYEMRGQKPPEMILIKLKLMEELRKIKESN